MSDPSNSICVLILFMLRSIFMSLSKNSTPYSYAVASAVVVHPLYFKTRTDRPNGAAEDLEPGNATPHVQYWETSNLSCTEYFECTRKRGACLFPDQKAPALLESYLRKNKENASRQVSRLLENIRKGYNAVYPLYRSAPQPMPPLPFDLR